MRNMFSTFQLGVPKVNVHLIQTWKRCYVVCQWNLMTKIHLTIEICGSTENSNFLVLYPLKTSQL
jgi:hypothetical protein